MKIMLVFSEIFFVVVFLLVSCQEFKNNNFEDDQKLVFEFVHDNANRTFQEAEGQLKYPYLIPSGYYHQLWDWDSFFMGIALLSFGSRKYLEGSMMNFLDSVNLTSGVVKGCLTPEGASPTLYQAKPVLIQGAYLSVSLEHNCDSMAKWYFLKDKMESFLKYWVVDRLDKSTGLPRWYDQMESGCDNLVYSNPPPTCTLCLSSPDIIVFLWRELEAFKLFLKHWEECMQTAETEIYLINYSSELNIENIEEIQKSLISGLMKYLWSQEDGVFMAFNTSSQSIVRHRVFMMAFPIWGGIENLEESVISSVVNELSKKDIFSEFGIRSTSSDDPRYNNRKEIDPFSNWQGPIWINSNSLIAYGLNSNGFGEFALDIGKKIIRVLANDLRINKKWHECYNSDNGNSLAAPGFLSWNTMSATLVDNLMKGIDPHDLKY